MTRKMYFSRGHRKTWEDIRRYRKTYHERNISLEDNKKHQKTSTRGNERHHKASKGIKRHQKTSKDIKKHQKILEDISRKKYFIGRQLKASKDIHKRQQKASKSIKSHQTASKGIKRRQKAPQERNIVSEGMEKH